MFSNKNKYIFILLLSLLGLVFTITVPRSALLADISNPLLSLILEITIFTIPFILLSHSQKMLENTHQKNIAKNIRRTSKIGLAITIIVVGIFIFIRRDIAAILGVLLSTILVVIIYIKY